MNNEDAEKIINILVGKNERESVINGILFGIGFANNDRSPNWELINRLVEEDRDITWWIEIEKQFFDMNKKLMEENIELWESLRRRSRI
ncbi:MAG: hypothetical protein LAN71_17070 [Acidobacteriia bacterium]|nr:hypothetical protein [Terriglobia bacterium]